MILTHEYLEDGKRLRWWQGMAYYRWDMHAVVCYPIPLNLLVRWALNLYVWMKATRRPDWRTQIWVEGYEAGSLASKHLAETQRQREFDRGKEAGWVEGRESIIKTLENFLR